MSESKERAPPSEAKYCPLLTGAFRVLYPCVKGKCAWWDELDEQCLMESLKYALRGLW